MKRKIRLIFLMWLSVFVIAACGGAEVEVTPTPTIQVAEATKVSTEVPAETPEAEDEVVTDQPEKEVPEATATLAEEGEENKDEMPEGWIGVTGAPLPPAEVVEYHWWGGMLYTPRFDYHQIIVTFFVPEGSSDVNFATWDGSWEYSGTNATFDVWRFQDTNDLEGITTWAEQYLSYVVTERPEGWAAPLLNSYYPDQADSTDCGVPQGVYWLKLGVETSKDHPILTLLKNPDAGYEGPLESGCQPVTVSVSCGFNQMSFAAEPHSAWGNHEKLPYNPNNANPWEFWIDCK